MRIFFRTGLIVGCGLAVAMTLGACSDTSAENPEALLVGAWTQSAPITMEESGVTISMTNGYVTYAKDGTSNGGLSMRFEGLPENMSKFDITSDATWRIEDGVIIENMVNANISSKAGSPQGEMMAAEMENVMREEAESRSVIKSLTKSELVIYQAETDLTLTYSR